jgi:hypothetical protein
MIKNKGEKMIINKFFDLSLEDWQNKVLPPPYNPIFLEGESVPIHLNKNPNLLKGELCFKEFYYNHDIIVSNIGRIKYKNEFADQFYDGVCYINTNNIKHPREDVHRLVALPWFKYNGNDYCAIHHINNNGYNNNMENLLVTTPAQHEMIHIKGIWKHENVFMEFYKNEFVIYNNTILYNGMFSFMDVDIKLSTDTRLKLSFGSQEITLSHQNIPNKKIKVLNGFTDNKMFLNGYWERFKYELNVLK